MECQLLYMQNLIIMGENIKIDNKEIKLNNLGLIEPSVRHG